MKLKIQDTSDSSTIEASGSFAKMPTTIIRDATLSNSAFRLYAGIHTYAWESLGSACWASQKTLSDDLGMGVATIRRAAAELVKRGLIECDRTPGQTNHYRPKRAQNERHPAQNERTTPLKMSDEADDVKKTTRSSSSAERPAEPQRPADPITTTTDDLSNVGDDDVEAANAEYDLASDAEGLLCFYDWAIEEATGRMPTRRDGDKEAARALVSRMTTEAYGEEFSAVIAWAMSDEYSAQRVGGSFKAMAKCYDAIAAKYAAIPKVGCQGMEGRCENRFVPSANERAAIKWCAAHGREPELICPECREHYGMEQAA